MPYKDKEAARAYHTEWQRTWRAAHPEKASIYRAAADPMKTAYNGHKGGAKKRNIPFLLTFEQWRAIWQASGKWQQRGVKKGQYVMARFGDTGPYAVGNVRICTQTENHLEAHLGRRRSIETRSRMSASQQGKKHSEESRKRMSAAQRARQARHANGGLQLESLNEVCQRQRVHLF